MFNILLGKSILCIFLIIVVCEIKTSEVPRPRGVSLSRVSLYPPDKDFTCFDGSLTIPFLQVNDNYCDCADGSDEPGTSACPNGLFYCTNAGHKPLILPASRVNDGICDCCDASDEYATPNSNCVNNCNELGRTARAEAQKRAELIKLGSQMRSELSQKGILLKQDNKEKLLVLNRNKKEAEHLRKEKEALKKEAEDLESVALASYKKIEDEQEPVQQEDSETNRNEAQEAFNRFDSNKDGKLEISELQTRPTFDRDRNGEITEEEARFFLDENSEVDFEDFYVLAWPKVKPFLMLESGLFKPPAQNQEPQEEATATEALDMHPDDEEDDHHEEELDEGYGEEADDNEDEADQETEADREDVVQNTPVPQYDEETQHLINQATEARQEFNNAEQAVTNIQNEIKDIEDSLQKDYGSDEEFASLDGQCFEYTDREYIYKLCPFDQVTQRPKSGGADTKLGQWGSWVGSENKYDVMLLDRGQSCWNGPQRSAHVRVNCGSDNALTSVAEPNRCEYVMDFTTPAACNPALVDRASEDAHDEL